MAQASPRPVLLQNFFWKVYTKIDLIFFLWLIKKKSFRVGNSVFYNSDPEFEPGFVCNLFLKLAEFEPQCSLKVRLFQTPCCSLIYTGSTNLYSVTAFLFLLFAGKRTEMYLDIPRNIVCGEAKFHNFLICIPLLFNLYRTEGVCE